VADSTKGELVENSGDFKYITACETPQGRALLVCIASGGGPLPSFRTKWVSGTLVGANAPTFGFSGDVPFGLSSDPIQYPVGTATANGRLSLFVDENTFVATTTRFEIYQDGAATGQFIDVAAGVVGFQPVLVVALAFAAGQRFDLRVSNPGGVAEVFKEISYGFTADLY
jgi:hypothetical protein